MNDMDEELHFHSPGKHSVRTFARPRMKLPKITVTLLDGMMILFKLPSSCDLVFGSQGKLADGRSTSQKRTAFLPIGTFGSVPGGDGPQQVKVFSLVTYMVRVLGRNSGS